MVPFARILRLYIYFCTILLQNPGKYNIDSTIDLQWQNVLTFTDLSLKSPTMKYLHFSPDCKVLNSIEKCESFVSLRFICLHHSNVILIGLKRGLDLPELILSVCMAVRPYSA